MSIFKKRGKAEQSFYEPIAVSGVELRREGDWAVVLVEIDGEYHEVMREYVESNFDHHVSAGGIRTVLDEAQRRALPKGLDTLPDQLLTQEQRRLLGRTQ